MWKLKFRCELLAPLVLSENPATEGNKKSLDYIPGSKFLGIAAAKLYKNLSPEEAFDCFHSGLTSFGNAYPVIENDRSFPVPFNWRMPKLAPSDASKEMEIYVHGRMGIAQERKITEAKGQLKQTREGYFNSKGLVKVSHEFSLKSAYDRETKKSKDSQMYAYSSIPEGSIWEFEVFSEKEELIEKLKHVLVGKNRIGKSRTAQYGLVDIKLHHKEIVKETTISPDEKGEVWLYAETDCAFFDEFGIPTLQPNPIALGLPEGSTIDWEKTQIRTKQNALWNQKRNALDPEKLLISKGSVWVSRVPTSFTVKSKPVGAYTAEGLGRLVYNPDFLHANEEAKVNLKISEKKITEISKKSDTITPEDEAIISFLKKNRKETDQHQEIINSVEEFIAENDKAISSLSKSQWGHLRAMAKRIEQLWICIERLSF